MGDENKQAEKDTTKKSEGEGADKKLGALENVNIVHAAGAMGATTQTWGSEVVLAKTGTGTYTATLDRALAAADGAILVTMRGNVGLASVAHTSDTVKTITTFAVDGSTATDKAFDFLAIRKPSGM